MAPSSGVGVPKLLLSPTSQLWPCPVAVVWTGGVMGRWGLDLRTQGSPEHIHTHACAYTHSHTHTRVHWPFIQVQERVEGSAQKEPPGPRPQGRGRQTSSGDKESPPQRLLPGQKVHPSSQHPPGEEVVTLLHGCAWHPPAHHPAPGGQRAKPSLLEGHCAQPAPRPHTHRAGPAPWLETLGPERCPEAAY